VEGGSEVEGVCVGGVGSVVGGFCVWGGGMSTSGCDDDGGFGCESSGVMMVVKVGMVGFLILVVKGKNCGRKT